MFIATFVWILLLFVGPTAVGAGGVRTDAGDGAGALGSNPKTFTSAKL